MQTTEEHRCADVESNPNGQQQRRERWRWLLIRPYG
jgi:hypothetical protein